MHLSHATMVERMLHADTSYNGVFITAVKTTGIYCLPGCRARKPKPENMEFFASPDLAVAAGYRACKQCRPDDFYQGLNPDETLIEHLVAALRDDPAQFADVQALANAIHVGQTKLFELFRVHYHTTPADMVLRMRVAAARRALLHSDTAISAIAHDVGFESLSAFQENFRKYSALSPREYRALRDSNQFTLSLPADYPLQRILNHLGRDPHNLTGRVAGTTWFSTLRLTADAGVVVQTTFDAGTAHVTVLNVPQLAADEMDRVYQHVIKSIGLTCDPQRFAGHLAKSPELARLIDGQTGLRIPLISDVFDGITWAIIGQQINLPFAFTLRHALIKQHGQLLTDDLYLAPTAETLAQLDEADLTVLRFSRSKASYLIGIARAIVAGELPLATLNDAAFTRIERLLLAQRGIGPWSAHYVLLRAYGFGDCVPVGDTALTSSLQTFFKLEQRPDQSTTLALMAGFSPFRSLATFHLWQRFADAKK